MLLRQGLSFLTNLLLARALLPEEYASYVTYYNFSLYIVLAANFGFSEYMLVKSNQQTTIERYLAFFLLISISIFTASLSVVSFFDANPLFFLVLFKVFLENILPELLLPWYQKTSNFKKLTAINFTFSAFSIVMLLALLAFNISLELFISGSVAISLVIMGYQLINILDKSDFPSWSSGRQMVGSDLINYGLNYITIPIYMRLVPFVVVIILKGKDVAEFNLAFTISSAALILSMSQIKIILPKLITDPDPSQEAFKNIKSLSAINLAILVMFVLLGKMFIQMAFGNTYEKLYLLTILLLFLNFLQSVSGLLAAILVAKKYQKQKLKIQLEVIAVSVCTSTLFITLWGIYGAVLAVGLMYVHVIIRTGLTLNGLGFLSFSSFRNSK